MRIILHRVNSLAALRGLAPGWGAEVDLRSSRGRLILNHEVHAGGDPAETFLRRYAALPSPGVLILNPKEDGHEAALLALVRGLGIRDWFFLDLTLPTLVRLAARGRVRNVAVRVSEFEPPEAALRFRGLAAWVWLDSFSGRPPSLALARRLKRDFKVCLVSPELQGFGRGRIRDFAALAPLVDAVCTDFPRAWGEGRRP